MSDDDGRPHKRQKTAHIPDDALLIALPALLAHPPTHRNHAQSLVLSQLALRRYLALPELDAVSEFRALVELAEIGFRIGLEEPGVESEVGRVISRALVIAAKHPSLRIYRVHVTTLSARLATYQGNPKSAQNTLKKLLTSFLTPTDPPHVVYAAHLAYITAVAEDSRAYRPETGNSKALAAIRDLHDLAKKNGHAEVVKLARVLELRDLVANGMWSRVGETLAAAEAELGMFDDSGEESESKEPPQTTTTTTTRKYTPLEHVLRVHVAMAGVLYHTHVGACEEAQVRIKKMHPMLDGAAFAAFGEYGFVEVQLSSGVKGKGDVTPLHIQVTHPRTLLCIGFLVSSVAKRDPTGRKPKRRQFASEGVKVVDNELKKELCVPMWASSADVHAFREQMNRLRADLICELVGVAIQRSEFDEAEYHISHLISHTRTHGLFNAYAARLTLHQAHLAHALGRWERAAGCYRVAAWLSRARHSPPSHSQSTSSSSANSSLSSSPMKSPTKKSNSAAVKQEPIDEEDSALDDEDDGQEDYWLNVSARLGDLWLRVGLAGQSQEGWEQAMKPLREEGKALLAECDGLGGTIQAVGAVLGACLGEECLGVKAHLRTALTLSTNAEDNYLRPLVLALCADQYFHTAPEHAEVMLQTADGLAAGLGAQPKPKPNPKAATSVTNGGGETATDKVGNAHLRMWIGERVLDLKRRKKDEEGAARQVVANEALRKAVRRVEKRKCEAEGVSVGVDMERSR